MLGYRVSLLYFSLSLFSFPAFLSISRIVLLRPDNSSFDLRFQFPPTGAEHVCDTMIGVIGAGL